MADTPTARRPDVIVGIDLGQTCTGVAYCQAQAGETVRQIQRWPGVAMRNENKVPTRLVYENGANRPVAWGFEAEDYDTDRSLTVREWFKTSLDPAGRDRHNKANDQDKISQEQVRHWFRDFLTSLCGHIQEFLKGKLPNFEWSSATVEFLFSMPTIWSPTTVEAFREIVCQAGFEGGLNARHSVTMSLTEAEAAAVYTSTDQAGLFKEGEIMVVCDAGGGTTDLSALEVTQTYIESLSLRQLKQVDVVHGSQVGSAGIDRGFMAMARQRLEAANKVERLNIRDIHDAAWLMARSKAFQNVKCIHGASYATRISPIPVPGLHTDYTNKDLGIAEGSLHLQTTDLNVLFDEQVEKLSNLINKQLKALASKDARQVNHLVLSGGLAQSAYVQQKLKERFSAPDRPSNAQRVSVVVAEEPQMAVSKGLVQDRLRKLNAGQSVLGWRCCRASYGLLCRKDYDEKDPNHFGLQPSADEIDRHLFLSDCVDWVIKKGHPVTVDTPIIHRFQRNIRRGEPNLVFPTNVVVSYVDPERLPYQKNASVEKLCDVLADFTTADSSKFQLVKKSFWNRDKTHQVIQFDVKVIIGPADLQFELWFDNERMSKDVSIKVEWAHATDPSTAALVPPKGVENGFYRASEQKRGRSPWRIGHRS